jgi:hypothetical protein
MNESVPDEDDTWYESLAGRTGQESTAEGASLRAAIRAYQAHPNEEAETIDPAREAELIARARDRGILPHDPSEASRNRLSGRRFAARRWQTWLAAAGLAAIVVGVTFRPGEREPAPVVRGTHGVVRIQAQDPQGLQRELIRELSDAGVRATGYDSLGRKGVDADLPVPLPDAVRGILARHGIALPADSVLEIEIEPAASP